MLHVGLLLGVFFNPEDGDDVFPKMLVDFERGTVHYIPEDRTLQNVNSFYMQNAEFSLM
jgi:hypothetical protein